MIEPNDSNQEGLLYVEGPDERGCVWAHGADSRHPWARHWGTEDKVAEILSQCLGSIDYDEVEASR